MKFVHRISKGSRFNQIYIPVEMNNYFEAGDFVEVRLIKKKTGLYYSKNRVKLSRFKERLIREIFNYLDKYEEIKQIFIFGSFLTANIEYNDIDILIFSEGDAGNIEKKIYNSLRGEFNLKFHILLMRKDKMEEMLKIDPLNRSMLHYFVSNKPYNVTNETEVDERHIKFLLMLPEDLLKVGLDRGRIYYDALRRVIAIENFLKKDEIAPDKIDEEIRKIMGYEKLEYLKKDGLIKGKIKDDLNNRIKEKLNFINKMLKNVEKR